MQKDYYQILGVPKVATTEEVKAAFKALCLRFYPGNQKEKDANLERHFGDIAEAYQVLSNDKDRAFYDHLGYKKFCEGVTDRFGNRIAGFQGRKGWQEVYLEFCGADRVYTSVSPVADDFLSYMSTDARKGRLNPKNVCLEQPITLLDLMEPKMVEVRYQRTVVEADGIRTKLVETVKLGNQKIPGARRVGLL